MEQAQQIIKRASQILRVAGGWSQGTAARNAKNKPLSHVNERGAASFCLVGALNKALLELPYCDRTDALYYTVFGSIRKSTKQKCIIAFNDAPKTTKKDVLAVLKKAGVRCGKA